MRPTEEARLACLDRAIGIGLTPNEVVSKSTKERAEAFVAMAKAFEEYVGTDHDSNH